MDIGERLRLLRLALDMSVAAQFAAYIGIEPQTYNNWERGRQRPQLDMALLICRRVPGLTLDWIYLGEAAGLPMGLNDKLIEAAASLPSMPASGNRRGPKPRRAPAQ